MSSLNKTFMRSTKYNMRSKYTAGSPSSSPKIKNLGDWHQTITSGDKFIDEIPLNGRSPTRENKISNNDLAISSHFDSSRIAPPSRDRQKGLGMGIQGSNPNKFKAVKTKPLDYSSNDKQKKTDKTK